MTTGQQKEAAPGCAGKTVIVVGGTRGIGKAVSLALASAGAQVVLTGRDETSTAPWLQNFEHAASMLTGWVLTSKALYKHTQPSTV